MIQIIIPCYNEAERFNKEMFFSYFDVLEQIHYLFVNDGSTDATKSMLDAVKNEAFQRNPEVSVQVLNLPENVGKAEAVRQGVLTATENKDTKYIAYFDADFSAPLTEINNLKKAMTANTNRKAVLGSRIKKVGSFIERSSMRHFTGRIFATVVNNTILKIAIYDTQCGAKLFTKECAQQVFKEPFVSRWLFDVEVISRLQELYPINELNQIIFEQPLTVWKEMGDSKIRLKDLLKMPYQLFLIYKNQKK